MSSIGKELGSFSKKAISVNADGIKEANVIGLGSGSGKYKVKLRNGTVINDVVGDVGLTIGQSVTLARFAAGRLNRHSILSVVGSRSTGTIREVEV